MHKYTQEDLRISSLHSRGILLDMQLNKDKQFLLITFNKIHMETGFMFCNKSELYKNEELNSTRHLLYIIYIKKGKQ